MKKKRFFSEFKQPSGVTMLLGVPVNYKMGNLMAQNIASSKAKLAYAADQKQKADVQNQASAEKVSGRKRAQQPDTPGVRGLASVRKRDPPLRPSGK